MKKLSFLLLPLIVLTFFPLSSSAAELIITAPIVNDPNSLGIQTEINNKIAIIQSDLNTKYFSKFKDQNDLARGFGNANNAAANVATNQGYQNYDLFSVQVGMMAGAAAPSMNIPGAIGSIKDIKDNGDLYAGIGTGAAINVGLNSSFLFENLYLSGKFGYIQTGKRTISNVDIEADQFLIGIGANYNLIDEVNILFGLAHWRGISLGTGLIYHTSSTMVGIKLADQSQIISGAGYSGTVRLTDITPTFTVDTKTLTVPVDIATSIQALWLFNLSAAAGADFNITSSTNTLGVNGKIHISGTTTIPTTAPITQSAPGSLSARSTSSSDNSFFDYCNPKVSASVGLNLSVLKIDVPVVYYPLTRSAAVGLQAGVVW